MRLLLDTHVLLWWLLDEGPLSPEQLEALEHAESAGEQLGLAAISLWEAAKLHQLGRIDLRGSVDVFFRQLEAHRGLVVYPLTPQIALESTRLGDRFPRDPADQLIAATARVHGLSLVTADRRIRTASVVSVV